MIMSLIRKDILVAKKYVLASMLVVIGIPLFVMLTAPELTGFFPFLYMVIMEELLLMQAISQEEAKYPKAAALLCATPYPRSSFVKAKYVFFLLRFSYCCIIFILFMLFRNQLSEGLDLFSILLVLLVSITIYGIYMPIEFKYGLVKSRFIFMIAVPVFATGPAIITSLFPGFTMDFSALAAIPSFIINIVLALASAAIFGISMMASTKIYLNKDL